MTTPPLPYAHLGEGLATDYFQVQEQFTDEQWEHFMTTRRFVDEEVLPAINEYWEAAELPWPLMRRLADLGLYGEDIAGYGCPGMSPLARGLVNMELHRGDGSLGTFLGVQSGLAMKSIDLLGSEAQQQALVARHGPPGRDRSLRACRARPRLGLGGARDDRSPAARRLGARRRQALDRQRLYRRRRRRLGTIRRGRARGARDLAGGDRARRRVGPGQRPAAGANTFKDAGQVLVSTRSTCAWAALAHAVAAYDAALTYSKQRV
jgi:glutaryl-CoA dehydrogenase